MGVALSAIVLAIVLNNNSDAKYKDPPQIDNVGNEVQEERQEEEQKETPQVEKTYSVTSVSDGDTIKIDYDGTETPVRLIGIDTPETVDPRVDPECYGQEASDYLKNLLDGKKVKIEADPTQDDIDKYGRLLRYVYLDNEDVGLKIIEGGYGSEYTYNESAPYKKQTEYKTAQTKAKQDGKGQWADGACTSSKSEPTNDTTEVTVTQPKCVIKGNISKKGEKIYHLPGQRYYDDTVITESKGERWFCTEQEAINAGWRKSKV